MTSLWSRYKKMCKIITESPKPGKTQFTGSPMNNNLWENLSYKKLNLTCSKAYEHKRHLGHQSQYWCRFWPTTRKGVRLPQAWDPSSIGSMPSIDLIGMLSTIDNSGSSTEPSLILNWRQKIPNLERKILNSSYNLKAVFLNNCIGMCSFIWYCVKNNNLGRKQILNSNPSKTLLKGTILINL